MMRVSHTHDAVTSLIDFYGFQGRPTDHVGELERQIGDMCRERSHHTLRDDRIFAYVQRHEFEALLFSDVPAFARMLDIPRNAGSALADVRARFASPEDINDSPATAPSRRILDAVPNYSKVADGSIIASEVGIETMRRECPRFGSWLTRLEALGVDG